jgi:hypothetical protein
MDASVNGHGHRELIGEVPSVFSKSDGLQPEMPLNRKNFHLYAKNGPIY